MVEQSTRITIATPVEFADELPETVDVAIIGGGVIGVFSALYLARAGVRVLLCEKGRIAGEQSSRNWGWVRQQGRDSAEVPIMMRALDLWHEANAQTSGACGMTTCGTYFLASSEAELAKHEAWLPIAQAHGLDTRRIGRAEIDAAFSGMAKTGWIGGIVTPSDARAEPWRAVPAVARLAQSEGVVIREDCAVRTLDIEAGRITGIVTEHGVVKCNTVVLAAGAWSSIFARRHGVQIPQLAVRATVAQTAPMPAFFNGAATDEDLALRRREDGGYTLAPPDRHAFYLGPDAFRHFAKYTKVLREDWKSVNLKIAAPKGYPDGWATPRKWSGDDITPFEKMRVLEPTPDARDIDGMRDSFAARFPDIGRPDFTSVWAGMIDTMPDIVPVVDHVPDIDGLIMATGMSGHGFGIGPGFAQVVANMVTGAPNEFDMRRFRFGRFSDGSALEMGGAL